MAMLSMMKSLPLSYNRDMQEDKAILFDAVDVLKSCIHIYTKMLPKIKINSKTMGKAASQGYLNATDLADYLAVRGMPFREAHACAGQAVRYALDKKKELHQLSLKELQSFSSIIEEDIFKFLGTEEMVNRRKSAGGTATENVKAAIKKAKKDLENKMQR